MRGMPSPTFEKPNCRESPSAIERRCGPCPRATPPLQGGWKPWARACNRLIKRAPGDPWAIPESASRRAAALGDSGFAVPHKQYDLAALVDLAERENPNTRASWEVAREAAAGIGLAESAYLPQLSLQAIGGFQHTPLPMPKNLVPAGYFVSDTREVIPALALKWLLFDFGRRDAQLQAARADSFVANVAFTGAHQKLIFEASPTYFDLGAARGKLNT